MKGEIDKDIYCSTDSFIDSSNEFEQCELFGGRELTECTKENCRFYRHKHPTPSEYKEEYGFDVPDDMPVWFRKYVPDKFVPTDWRISNFGRVKKRYIGRYVDVVIACTPFPKPDDDWRPQ